MAGRIKALSGAVAVIVAALATSAILALLVRPFRVGPVGFDTAASVIHFDRLAAGVRLESFVTTTPKPLLTLVYGATHAVTADWRAISWAAIGAFGLAVVLLIVLFRRVVPAAPSLLVVPLACATLIGSRQLVLDVGAAYAVAWALIGWLLAGIGAVARPPLPWLVGLGLLVATLARLETSVVIALVAAASVVRAVRPARDPGADTWTARRLASAAGIGALALPIMLLHDWLLTGDPLFWSTVSTVYSQATTAVTTPAQVAAGLWDTVQARPIASLMAVVGVIGLVHRRSALGFGLVALGAGVAVLVLTLAARGTYVSARYYAPIEIAIVVAAGIGVVFAAQSIVTSARARLPPRAARPFAFVLVAAIAGATVIAAPFAPLDTATRASLDRNRVEARTADISIPVVAPLLAGRGLAPGQPKPAGPDPPDPVVLGPRYLRPRLSVDLRLPLWAVGGVTPEAAALDGSGLRPGQVVVHSKRYDRPQGAYAPLETTEVASLGPRQLVPVAELPLGVWILEVR